MGGTDTLQYAVTTTPTITPTFTDTPTITLTPTPTSTPTATFTPIPATATAKAKATSLSVQTTATADAKATAIQQATVNAHQTATAKATAAIESYRSKPPKGVWGSSNNGIAVSVGDFRYFTSTDVYSAGSGKKFVAFAVAVWNRSGTAISVNPYDFTLVDLDTNTYDHSVATYDYWTTPFPAVSVMSGDKAQGGMVFSVPAKTGPAKIVYRGGIFPMTTIVVDLRLSPIGN